MGANVPVRPCRCRRTMRSSSRRASSIARYRRLSSAGGRPGSSALSRLPSASRTDRYSTVNRGSSGVLGIQALRAGLIVPCAPTRPIRLSIRARSQRGGASMRRLALLLALPLIVVTAAPASSADAQTPKRGGVLRIAEREAPSLDPHLSISFLTHSYVSLAYSQLVRFPNGPEQKSPTDFSILPDLAEKWTVSKDGKVYTFTLRKGVRFHQKPPVNGREVVADDVKYSLERFMAKSGFATRFEPVSSIDVIDRHTVRVTLKEPYAPFLNHLANSSFCAILPREAEEKFKDFNHPDAVIGTGPFILKSYDKGVRMVFERNPDYFMKPQPYLDGAVVEITPDAAARLS